MSRVEKEFEALWSDDTASLSPDDAQAHYEAVVETYRQQAMAEPGPENGMVSDRAGALRILPLRRDARSASAAKEVGVEPISPEILIAFSARRPHEAQGRAGYDESNGTRYITLCTPGGRTRRVPLTITTLALDVIYRARPGETLLIAMYGLSTRVPEYGALLERRPKRSAPTDSSRQEGREEVGRELSQVLERRHLPIHVKSGHRMMHEKYVVNADTATVLTGTANMSTDVGGHHSEHHIMVSGNKTLADQFVADFETIWNRVGNQV